MYKVFLLLAIFFTASVSIYFTFLMPFIAISSLLAIIYFLWKEKQKGYSPQSDTYKEIEKLKKRRQKIDNNKHKHINDQIEYIATVWGYTKEQEKIIKRFVESRAYSQMYNTLTASLFPQMIALIDNCNAQEQKGCKREVSRRLRELIELLKKELQKKKSQNIESFITTLEVYDKLLASK